MVGSLEALMGAKAIAGGCALSDPISTARKRPRSSSGTTFILGV